MYVPFKIVRKHEYVESTVVASLQLLWYLERKHSINFDNTIINATVSSLLLGGA